MYVASIYRHLMAVGEYTDGEMNAMLMQVMRSETGTLVYLLLFEEALQTITVLGSLNAER